MALPMMAAAARALRDRLTHAMRERGPVTVNLLLAFLVVPLLRRQGVIRIPETGNAFGKFTVMTFGKFFVTGLVVLFGGTFKPAHAQFPFPIPPPPPPVFTHRFQIPCHL